MDLSSLVAVQRVDHLNGFRTVTPVDEYTPERIGQEARLILRDAPEHIAAAFRKAGVGVEFCTELLTAAVVAVRALGLIIEGSRTVYYVEPTVSHYLLVRASEIKWTDGSWAISDALAEQFDDPVPDVIGFSCRPIDCFTPGRHVEVL